jgi:hypothetical protein
MPSALPSATRVSDGQTSFEGGVDSGRNPTIQSEFAPTGLKRNQVAWAANATVRGGGIGCRTGFAKIELNFPSDAVKDLFELGKFQGDCMYSPLGALPYKVVSISGRIFAVHVESDNSVVDIGIVADPNSTTPDHVWFCQAEEFLVIQDGDTTRLPLIWDGVTMRRSNGLAGAPAEIPAGTCMDYYMGRLWVANGREYAAGDIVGGPSGTAPYGLRDAVLRWTENAFLSGGGAFTVPTQSGDITALKHTANLDTSLGQGQLFIFTRNTVFTLDVPVTRTQWTAAVDANQPLQRVAQIKFGSTSQESVVHVNGDLFYRAPDGIRSLFMAIRDFGTWGNIPISRNCNRVIDREDRALHRFASGIQFDNRIYQTCYPVATTQGTTFEGMLVLDFDLISSFGERLPPAWEGMFNGLNVFHITEADFGGVHRAFATCLQAGLIEVWEITRTERWDNGDGRIEWAFETPAYVCGDQFQLKKLVGLELWIDKLFGLVDFEVWYRPDQYPCWQFWHIWQECAVKNPCEDPDSPTCYVMQSYREQYRATVNLPQPPDGCGRSESRPFRYGYQFQVMIKVRGWARIRGMVLHTEPVARQNYEGIVC